MKVTFCDDCSIRRVSRILFDAAVATLVQGRTYYMRTGDTYGVYMYPMSGSPEAVLAAWETFHGSKNDVDRLFGRGKCACIPPTEG